MNYAAGYVYSYTSYCFPSKYFYFIFYLIHLLTQIPSTYVRESILLDVNYT